MTTAELMSRSRHRQLFSANGLHEDVFCPADCASSLQPNFLRITTRRRTPLTGVSGYDGKADVTATGRDVAVREVLAWRPVCDVVKLEGVIRLNASTARLPLEDGSRWPHHRLWRRIRPTSGGRGPR